MANCYDLTGANISCDDDSCIGSDCNAGDHTGGNEVGSTYTPPSFASMFDVGSKMKLFGGGPASERAKMRHERKKARQEARADRKMVRTEGKQQRKADRQASRLDARSRRQDRKDARLDSRLGYYQEGGKTQIRKIDEGEEFEKISRKDRKKLKRKEQVRGETKPNDPKLKLKRKGRGFWKKITPGFKNLSGKKKREMTGYETENVSDYIGDEKRIDAALRKRFIGMKTGEARKNLLGRTVHQVLPEGTVAKKREKHTERNPGLLEENIEKGKHPYAKPEKRDQYQQRIYETKKSQEKRAQQKEGFKDTPEYENPDDRIDVGTFPGTREDTMDFEEGSGPQQNIPKNVDASRKRRYVFDPKTGVYTEKEKRKLFGYKKTGREYVDEKYRQDAQEIKDIRESKESNEPTKQEKKERKKQKKQEKKQRREDSIRLNEEALERGDKTFTMPDGSVHNVQPKFMKEGGTLMERYSRKFSNGGIDPEKKDKTRVNTTERKINIFNPNKWERPKQKQIHIKKRPMPKRVYSSSKSDSGLMKSQDIEIKPNWNKKLTRLTNIRDKKKEKGKSTERIQKKINKEYYKLNPRKK